MLMSAPKSMPVPNGDTPALSARRCSGLVVSLSLPDSPRNPSTSEYEHKHKEDTGENGALDHSARNGAQRIARFAAQRGRAFESDKAEHRKHQGGPKGGKRNAAQPELVHVEMESEVDRHDGEDDADQADRADLDPQHQFGGELYIAIGNESRERADNGECNENAAVSSEGIAAKARWCSRALRRQPRLQWQDTQAAVPTPPQRQRPAAACLRCRCRAIPAMRRAARIGSRRNQPARWRRWPAGRRTRWRCRRWRRPAGW